MSKPVIIGIAGGSASGKTSIAHRLKDSFEQEANRVVILRMDDYYKDQSDLTFEQRLAVNYDHPFAFDIDLLVSDLDQLRADQPIQKPLYDFVHYTRSGLSEPVCPADVVVLEGLFVLEEPQLRSRCDIKVYVETDADIRILRRLMRDVEKRGRTLRSVVDQYLSVVKPMHEQFIEPSKRYADVIIPEGAHNRVAVDLLTTKIRSIIHVNV